MKLFSKPAIRKPVQPSEVRALTEAEINAVSGGITTSMAMIIQPAVLPPSPCRFAFQTY